MDAVDEMVRHQKENDIVLTTKVDEKRDGVNPLIRETDDFQINSISNIQKLTNKIQVELLL